MVQKHFSIRNTIIIFVSLLALFLLLGFPAIPVNAAGTLVTLDSGTGNSGNYSALKLNSSGFAVISYYGVEDQDLRVAVCNDATCTNPTIAVVDSTGDVGQYTSLALDSGGLPVISYYDVTNGNLKLAYCGNATCTGVITISTVDNTGDVGKYTSLVLNGSGNPVISYYDVTNGDLKVAVCTTAACTASISASTVDSAGDVGKYTSLVLNGSGNPVVSYYDVTNGDLKLARCGDSTCGSGNTLTTVYSNGDVGADTSLALNSSGNPVISFGNGSGFSFITVAVCGNATCSSGNSIRGVASNTTPGAHTSLALNSSGNPVVSYANSSGVELLICDNAICSAGGTRTISASTSYPSLVLNASGFPVISYAGFNPNTLTVALCSNATCSTSTIRVVDQSANVGQYTSLALNSSGNPVISYYDAANGNLKLGVCGDALCSSKTMTVVDSTGDVGRYASLVLNSSGNPVIAYTNYNSSVNSLKLARCGNAACSSGNIITTIDSSGNVGKNASLLLNSSGNPVISYYDETNVALKVIVCDSDACTGSNTVTTVATGGVGEFTSLALNSSGNPVITYYDGTQGQLKIVVCDTLNCIGTSTVNTVDNSSGVGKYVSLVLNSSGNPVISYYDETNGDLKVAVCGNATCSSATRTTVDSSGDVGQYTSLRLSSADNPMISYYDATNGDLKVAICLDVICSSKILTVADSTGNVGQFNSAKLRADGYLFVSYYDVTNRALKLDSDIAPGINTATPTATNTSTRTNTPTVTSTATNTATPTNTPIPPRPDTIGVYKDGKFYLRNSNTTGTADITALFGGDAADLPLAGDWNGDGVDTVGVYRSSTGFFYLSDSNISPNTNYTVLFGNPGDTPFAGKWANDMTGSGIGVYRNSNGILYQRKSLTNGFDDFFAVFGNPGDVGFAGDWDGNGLDSIGVYRSSTTTWYLTNNSTPSGITFSDISFVLNIGSNGPIVGDWDDDGDSTPGYLDANGAFMIFSTNGGSGTYSVFAFGPAGGKPVAGKWIASSKPSFGRIIGSGQPGSSHNPDGGDSAD